MIPVPRLVRVCAPALAMAAVLSSPALAADVAPCQLLTQADVQSALGGQWQVWQDLSSQEVCAFQRAPDSMVTLTLTTDPLGAARILEVRQSIAGEKAFPAAGPGTGAYRLVMPSANVVVFGKGETVAQLEVTYGASSDLAVLERLAQTAYDRLP